MSYTSIFQSEKPALAKKSQANSRPSWIRGKISFSATSRNIGNLLRQFNLKSVCEEAACPNKGECWEKKHVTFMILGDTCTRKCRFCNVSNGSPSAPHPGEPQKIAAAIKKLGLKYVVITSVTRDDLEDKGMRHFLDTVREIKSSNPETIVELLFPDLGGKIGFVREIAFSNAEIIGHNIETPQNLYPAVRPRADYARSLNVLNVLSSAKKEGAKILVKSSMMLGLGETYEDIFRTLEDLKRVGVDIVYIGQYLSPSKKYWPVKRYYTPREFKSLEKKAKGMGFGLVYAGPMVRSSYLRDVSDFQHRRVPHFIPRPVTNFVPRPVPR